MRADIGIALDGDADRVILVDERGHLVDGDQLLAVIAQSWKEDGRLAKPGIVSTVMSNLGLERFLEGQGIELVRTQVGDRYVLEQMLSRGYNIGGEPSGHIILSDYATTGDGFVAALQVLAVVQKLRRPVSEVCHRFEPLPQILKNVRYRSGKPLDDADRHRTGDPGDGRGRRPYPGRGSGRPHRLGAGPCRGGLSAISRVQSHRSHYLMVVVTAARPS
jgi:phosphoglucosamine mutase